MVKDESSLLQSCGGDPLAFGDKMGAFPIEHAEEQSWNFYQTLDVLDTSQVASQLALCNAAGDGKVEDPTQPVVAQQQGVGSAEVGQAYPGKGLLTVSDNDACMYPVLDIQ